MRYKAIVFDLDMTLVDSFKVGKLVDEDLVKKRGLTLPDLTERETWGMSIDKFAEAIRDANGQKITIDELKKFLVESIGAHYESMPIREPDVLKNIKAKSIKLGVLTNNHDKLLDKLLHNKYNFQLDFDVAWGGEQIGSGGKGIALKKLVKMFDCTANELLYVGDHVNDIIAAREAGVSVAAITTGLYNKEELEKYHPDYVIDSIKELLSLI